MTRGATSLSLSMSLSLLRLPTSHYTVPTLVSYVCLYACEDMAAAAAAAAAATTPPRKRARPAEDIKAEQPPSAVIHNARTQLLVKSFREMIQKINPDVEPEHIDVELERGGICAECFIPTHECNCPRAECRQSADRMLTRLNDGMPLPGRTACLLPLLTEACRKRWDRMVVTRLESPETERAELAEGVVRLIIWVDVDEKFYEEREATRLRRWFSELFGRGLILAGTGWNIRPLLHCAISRRRWHLATAMIEGCPGPLDFMDWSGIRAIDVACQVGAPMALTQLIVAASSEKTLCGKGRVATTPTPLPPPNAGRPLFTALDYMFAMGSAESVLNRTDNVILLLNAANIDGSGVDLLARSNGLSVEEYAVREYSLLEERGDDPTAIADLKHVTDVVADRLAQVRLYRSELVPALRAAAIELFKADGVVMLVGSYMAPRFEDLRLAWANGANQQPQQPQQQHRRPAAAAAAAAATVTLMEDESDT